jgi:hypothetical protein
MSNSAPTLMLLALSAAAIVIPSVAWTWWQWLHPQLDSDRTSNHPSIGSPSHQTQYDLPPPEPSSVPVILQTTPEELVVVVGGHARALRSSAAANEPTIGAVESKPCSSCGELKYVFGVRGGRTLQGQQAPRSPIQHLSGSCCFCTDRCRSATSPTKHKHLQHPVLHVYAEVSASPPLPDMSDDVLFGQLSVGAPRGAAVRRRL